MHFMTISHHFFANHINIFQKTVVQTSSDGHFEVLNISKSEFNQKLGQKTQTFSLVTKILKSISVFSKALDRFL